MENSEELKITFYKYLRNELNEEEARHFLKYLQSGDDREAFLTLIEESLDSPVSDQLLGKPEVAAILDKSFLKVTAAIDAGHGQKSTQVWPRIAIGIAAAIALIVLGVYFFSYTKNTGNDDYSATAQDVAPGKVGATLTLANGKKIRLSDAENGQIAKEAGIGVFKTADGHLIYKIEDGAGDPNKMNTLTTEKGETYRLILSDKSMVWMNAASSLTYSTGLNEHGLRKVKLDGEAYFQIAEDKEHPFIVETRQQEVEVLGTHFNINAYANEEEVTTTLLQGSVKISGRSGSKILTPGSQSSVNQHSISVEEVDTERAIAWKNNKFLFENDNIQYIMRMIERWYNVEVVYVGEMPTEKFGGGVSRFDNVSQVLRILESTGGVHFKIHGRKILVSK